MKIYIVIGFINRNRNKNKYFIHLMKFFFVKHDLKESVEVYKGRNLHPPPPPPPPLTVTDIVETHHLP